MPISHVFTGNPLNGTANDDFIIAYQGSTGTNTNTANGNDGDDWILGDSSNLLIPTQALANNAIGSAYVLDSTAFWTTDENPMFGNSGIPHVTVIAEATIGQSEYYAVTVGAGETITVDIDFADSSPIGVPNDLIAELRDSADTLLVSDSGGPVTEGGLGSYEISPGNTYDPYFTYTNTTGAAVTYYVRIRPFGGQQFTTNDTFVLNISVTGHAVGTNSTMGADTLNGGNGNDSIFGQGGADTLNGDAGNDLIHGGTGIDTINGGEGDDTLYGGDETSSNDEIVHGDGGDDIIYSTGNGHYYGDAGNDTIYAGLTSGSSEFLDGGTGIDTLDTTSFAAGGYTVNMVSGTTNFGESFTNFENLTTGNTADTVIGTGVGNIIKTNGGDDTIYGDGGNDQIEAGGGNDYISGGAGADTMNGGAGNDTFIVDEVGDSILEAGGGGYDSVYSNTSSPYVLTAGAEVELLGTYGAGNVDLYGNEFAQSIYGGAGNNYLSGGAGADAMRGLGGSDTYITDNVADYAFENVGEGYDSVYTNATHILLAGSEIEFLGTYGGAGNIDLYGNELAQSIWGSAGNNYISGGGGADSMRGQGGNDSYVVDVSGDLVFEDVGGGYDAVYTTTSYALLAGSEVELMAAYGAAGALVLQGNEFGQSIYGGSGADVLRGNGGNDTILGNGGADIAEFAGAMSSYTITISGGVYTVVDNDTVADGNDGTDTVHSVELLRFKNGETYSGGSASASTTKAEVSRQLMQMAQDMASFGGKTGEGLWGRMDSRPLPDSTGFYAIS